MSTANPTPIALITRPWPFVAVGFLLTLAGAGIFQSEVGNVVGSVVLALGLFLVGVGTAIQMQTPVHEAVPTEFGFEIPARFLVTIFQIGVIATFSWMLLAALLGIDPFGRNPPNLNVPMNIKAGPMVIAWILVVPLTVQSLRTMWRAPLAGSVETGLVLVIACIAVVVAGRSLPIEADSLRFFLVVALAIAFGVSLVTAPIAVRYAVLSILATLHFFAIITATLATPPSPWLATQVWHRLAHPYLEFMYLNNAYHFYSPEPGATTHVWLCVYYDTGEKVRRSRTRRSRSTRRRLGQDPGRRRRGEVPVSGRARVPADADADGEHHLTGHHPSPLPARRQGADPSGTAPQESAHQLDDGRSLARRHRRRRPRPDHAGSGDPDDPGSGPGDPVSETGGGGAQAHRVVRTLRKPQEASATSGVAARDGPGVSGHAFAPDVAPLHERGRSERSDHVPGHVQRQLQSRRPGKLNNPNEVLLNWVLPTLRAQPEHPDSPIFCWYLFHAGERRCIYRPDTKEYVRMTPELRRQFPPEWTENLWKYVPPDWRQDWE